MFYFITGLNSLISSLSINLPINYDNINFTEDTCQHIVNKINNDYRKKLVIINNNNIPILIITLVEHRRDAQESWAQITERNSWKITDQFRGINSEYNIHYNNRMLTLEIFITLLNNLKYYKNIDYNESNLYIANYNSRSMISYALQKFKENLGLLITKNPPSVGMGTEDELCGLYLRVKILFMTKFSDYHTCLFSSMNTRDNSTSDPLAIRKHIMSLEEPIEIGRNPIYKMEQDYPDP